MQIFYLDVLLHSQIYIDAIYAQNTAGRPNDCTMSSFTWNSQRWFILLPYFYY